MRRVASVILAVLLAAPPVNLSSAPLLGTVEGVVTVSGRPLSGVMISLINLSSGAISKAKSGGGGAFKTQVPPGDYVVTSDGRGGFAVGRGPTKLTVPAGHATSASIDLVALPMVAPVRIARLQEPPAPGQSAPVRDVPQAPFPESVQPLPPSQEPGALQEQPVFPQSFNIPATEAGVGIQHDTVGCLLAGQFPLIDAMFIPPEKVARARVYFKSSQAPDWYFIEMAPELEKFVGKLPRPRLEASPVTYYVQVTSTEFAEAQTPEVAAIVVTEASQCPSDRKVAAVGPSGPVQVFSAATGVAISPAGFAAGGLALTAGTIALIAGAVAVGVGTIIVTQPSNPPTTTTTLPTTPTTTLPTTTTTTLPPPTPVPPPSPVSRAR